MASIYVTFSGEQAGATYNVVISTASSSNVGSGQVPASGGSVTYDDSHGSNYYASADGKSSTFYSSSSTVNIVL